MAAFVEKLKNREKIFATTLVSIHWSGIIEIFKNDFLDFLILDLEHGSYSIESAENLIRTARAHELPVIVRAADTLYHLLSPCLDAGAQGLLVPRVETVEQAREALAGTRFPPLGRKGFGGFSLVRMRDRLHIPRLWIAVQLPRDPRVASPRAIISASPPAGTRPRWPSDCRSTRRWSVR